jgi:hypothetical protein
VLRIDPDGKLFCCSTRRLVNHALRFDDKGTLYVAAISGQASGGAA